MTSTAANLGREGVEELCRKLQVFRLSAEIYGGAKGLYDLGPMGCSIVNSLVSEWRNHFIHKEEMLEVKTSLLTPHDVLKASGHVDRFHDLMVRDVETQQAMRADHLLEDKLEEEMAELKKVYAQADAYTKEELGQKLQEYGVKSP